MTATAATRSPPNSSRTYDEESTRAEHDDRPRLLVRELPEGLDDEDEYLYPLLVPDAYANRRMPGGEVVSLRREVQEFTSSGKRYEWELFARNGWIDDSMLYLRSLLDLIAPHVAQPGYGGYFRHISDAEVTVFDFHDGTYEPIKIWGIDPR